MRSQEARPLSGRRPAHLSVWSSSGAAIICHGPPVPRRSDSVGAAAWYSATVASEVWLVADSRCRFSSRVAVSSRLPHVIQVCMNEPDETRRTWRTRCLQVSRLKNRCNKTTWSRSLELMRGEAAVHPPAGDTALVHLPRINVRSLFLHRSRNLKLQHAQLTSASSANSIRTTSREKAIIINTD
ncbi:unnamed protein product [Pleuronectes platessa]|uniref:Uncharacterized protein n=1 Tax=Pleuronectes platessa TaxID=8262 RepID=A0A9N7UMB6_PLEPL|nr:unnamed protein product [Pleuronectes platessa]